MQGSNPGFLHCRQTLYHLGHQIIHIIVFPPTPSFSERWWFEHHFPSLTIYVSMCAIAYWTFFFKWSPLKKKLDYKLLYNVVLVSAVQRRESAIYIYTRPLSLGPPSQPSPQPSRAQSWAPCASLQLPCSCLSVSRVVVCMSVPLSWLILPCPTPPTGSARSFSSSLSLSF